jgi:hypothetical protein
MRTTTVPGARNSSIDYIRSVMDSSTRRREKLIHKFADTDPDTKHAGYARLTVQERTGCRLR